MKYLLCLCGLTIGAFVVSPVQATLIGDDVTGSGTNLTTFNTGTQTVDGTLVPEFFGIIVDDAETISFEFDLRADTIFLSMTTNESGISIVPDFTVTFSDLDWVGLPDHVLTGVSVISDDPIEFMGGTAGQGLTWNISDHALVLVFNDFQLPEFRDLELQLVAEEQTTTPIPEPATMVLLGIGLGGLALRHRRRPVTPGSPL